MKKLHILGIGVLAIPFVILSVYGANKGYEEMSLTISARALHSANESVYKKLEEISQAKIDLETLDENALVEFCDHVTLKKALGREVSPESLSRYGENCFL